MPGHVATSCPGCALALEPIAGPTDPFGGASPACFARFEAILTREFSDRAYFASHQLSGHAYFAQHPSSASRAAVQSLWLHLVGLQLRLEQQATVELVGRVMARMTVGQPVYDWLAPPPTRGDVTVRDLLAATNAGEHAAVARRWAESVWRAWRPHHDAVRAMAARLLGPTWPVLS